jgi:hypothetical protein
VLKSSQLSTVQSVAKLIRRLPVVLTLLVILLYGFAIYLAGPRRRETLRSVGICFLIAGVVTLILRGFVGNEVVDALAKSESVKPATEAVWSIGTSLLATVATSAIAIGILLVVAAWLVGPTRFATRLRRQAAPYVEEHRGGAYAVAGLVFLALIAWAPIPALGTALGIILFAVLFALGTEFLCRQILRESSDRGAAETDGQTTAAET